MGKRSSLLWRIVGDEEKELFYWNRMFSFMADTKSFSLTLEWKLLLLLQYPEKKRTKQGLKRRLHARFITANGSPLRATPI